MTERECPQKYEDCIYYDPDPYPDEPGTCGLTGEPCEWQESADEDFGRLVNGEL